MEHLGILNTLWIQILAEKGLNPPNHAPNTPSEGTWIYKGFIIIWSVYHFHIHIWDIPSFIGVIHHWVFVGFRHFQSQSRIRCDYPTMAAAGSNSWSPCNQSDDLSVNDPSRDEVKVGGPAAMKNQTSLSMKRNSRSVIKTHPVQWFRKIFHRKISQKSSVSRGCFLLFPCGVFAKRSLALPTTAGFCSHGDTRDAHEGDPVWVALGRCPGMTRGAGKNGWNIVQYGHGYESHITGY